MCRSNREVIANACRKSPVGKLTRSALYFHRSAFMLPEEIIMRVLQAEVRLADAHSANAHSANVVKVRRDGSAVSFLWYPDFETDPHPELRRSVHVPGTGKISFRYYRHWESDANPPILHRKEAFLSADHPLYGKFAALTRAEERAGLLTDTPGFRQPWQEKLEKAGYRIWGHRLRRSS